MNNKVYLIIHTSIIRAIAVIMCGGLLAFLTNGCVSMRLSKTMPKARPDGLIAHYTFDGNAYDCSGNGYHGVVHGARLTEDRFGNSGHAYLIDGLNAISLDHRVFNGLGDFTVSIWLNFVKLNADGQRPMNSILTAANDTFDNEVLFWYGFHFHSFIIEVKKPGRIIFNNSQIEEKRWHHVVLIRKGPVTRFYLDGVLVDEKKITDETIAVARNGLILGQEQDRVGGGFALNQNLSGKVDDLYVYNRALSQDEIKKLYESQDASPVK